MRKVLLLAMLLVLAGAVSAHPGHQEHSGLNETGISALMENPGELASLYNDNVDQLPSVARNLVSGERMNLHVDTGEGEEVIGVEMEGDRIENLSVGGVENPSVEFHTDVETIEAIANSDDPAKEAVSAFNGPGITYRAHDLGSRIKFAIISVISKILAFFV